MATVGPPEWRFTRGPIKVNLVASTVTVRNITFLYAYLAMQYEESSYMHCICEQRRRGNAVWSGTLLFG